MDTNMNFNLEKSAFNLLEQNGITSIPVDTIALAKNLGIEVVKFSTLDKNELDHLLEIEDTYDAFGFYDNVGNNEFYYIYYDDMLDKKELRVVIAREIGKYIFEEMDDKEFDEIEFNFVTHLLVPSFSLFFLSELSVQEIMKVYDVNYVLAQNAHKLFKKRIDKFGNKLFKYESDVFMQIQ